MGERTRIRQQNVLVFNSLASPITLSSVTMYSESRCEFDDRRNSATGNFSSYTCIARNRRQGTSGEDVGRVTFRLPPTRSAAPRARFSERIIARPLRISRRALSFSLADTILNAGKKPPFAADDV